ncbi:hypothetical protein K439DRAFT_1365409, partial [Ramaria rubella]
VAVLMTVVVAMTAALFYAEQLLKWPYHTSVLSGRQWILELLHGNPRHIKEQLGMQKYVFRQLV